MDWTEVFTEVSKILIRLGMLFASSIIVAPFVLHIYENRLEKWKKNDKWGKRWTITEIIFIFFCLKYF